MDRFSRFGLDPLPTQFLGPRYELMIDGNSTGLVASANIFEDCILGGHITPSDWTHIEAVYNQELNVVKQLNVNCQDLLEFFKSTFLKGGQSELWIMSEPT